MQGIDYYSVLEISRSATPEEIRKAYARVAIREHPNRTKACDGSTLTLEQLTERCIWFQLANEAYEILSQPLLRAAFDQFGEKGLKNGVPARDPDLYLKPYKHHDDPFKTFRNFFGTESASGPVLLAWQFDAAKGTLRRPDGSNGPWFREDPDKIPLKLTLEQISKGGKTEVVMQRREIHDGMMEIREHIFEVEFPPGVTPGTEFMFKQEGHQAPKSIPGDVAVVVEEDIHEVFTRSGADLIAKFHVSLEEALLGCALEIPALDGRTLRVRVTDIITPGYELRVPGEGLPRCAPPCQGEEEPRKECFANPPKPTMDHDVSPCEGCACVDVPCVPEPENNDSYITISSENINPEQEDNLRGDLVLRFEVEYPSSVPAPRREALSRALYRLTPLIPQHRTRVTPISYLPAPARN